MSRGPFAKVYRALWDGTLGRQTEAWPIFVFMLAHADADGVVDLSVGAICGRTGWSDTTVRRAISVLESPDPESRSSIDDGRRIVRLDEHRSWGWMITNYAQYRDGDGSEWSRSYRERNAENIRERDRERKRLVRQVSASVRQVSASVREQAEAEAEVEAEEDTPPPPTPQDVGAEPLAPSPADVSGSPELPLAGIGCGAGVAAGGRAPRRTDGEPVSGRSGSGEALIALPVNAGPDYKVCTSDVDEWRRLYPAVDVEQSLRAMRGWLLANRERRKTVRGMPRFINGWLADDQNKARPAGPGKRPSGFRSGADERYRTLNANEVESET